MGKKITLRRKRRNRHNTRKKRNTRNTRKITIMHNKYSRKSMSSPQIRIHKGGVTPERSPHSPQKVDDNSSLEARLALLQQDTPKTPVVLSPYHIPPYVPKFADLPFPELSSDFESIDYEHRDANGLPLSYTSSPTIEPEDLPPTSLQVLGYNTHPFIKRNMLPNMKGAELPKLGRRQNLLIDAHGGIGNILTDNEKRLANHYLRVIEIGDYGGIVSINSPEYYKILNDILRNPKYRELFYDTHKGKELRARAYAKLCKYISDSRKPNCIKPSINKLDKYFKLIHLTHDRTFSGDREDKDVRETHIITAETLTSLEHQGLFVPLPHNKDKTGLPYFRKELFQLYPETSLLSKNTSISLIYNILPLAIKNNTQFNIFVTSCNYSERIIMVNPSIKDNSTGITQFLSKGKEFLFIIASLSSIVDSCLRKHFDRITFEGKETAFKMDTFIKKSDSVDVELIYAVARPLLCLKHSIFESAYTPYVSDKYNYETILPYFLGPIVPDGANISSNTDNELIDELNNSEPFKKSPNPIQSELYAMAKLYLIQEFIDNIGTVLEIAVSMLYNLYKIYMLVLEEIDNNPSNPGLTAGIIDLFENNSDDFLRLLRFLDRVYSDIYSYYLPKLQNDKDNKNPIFKAERFINKPLYKKFMKLHKSGSLFFDEHTNFMHESSSYENMNPYKYKQRINMDEIRDRMPDKGKFLSSKKSPRLSNVAKDKLHVSQ